MTIVRPPFCNIVSNHVLFTLTVNCTFKIVGQFVYLQTLVKCCLCLAQLVYFRPSVFVLDPVCVYVLGLSVVYVKLNTSVALCD